MEFALNSVVASKPKKCLCCTLSMYGKIIFQIFIETTRVVYMLKKNRYLEFELISHSMYGKIIFRITRVVYKKIYCYQVQIILLFIFFLLI